MIEPAAEPRPGPHRNAHRSRLGDEVLHDQEVADETQLPDHADLVLEALADAFVDRAVAADRAFPAQLLEVHLRRTAVVGLEHRQVVDAELDADVAALGDRDRLLQCFRPIGERRGHLRPRLQEQLVRAHPEALRIRDGLAAADAQHDVLRQPVVGLQVVHVVGGDARDAQLLAKRAQSPRDLALLLVAGLGDLEEEVVGAEQFAQLQGRRARASDVVLQHRRGDLRRHRARQGDDPFAVLLQHLEVDARPVAESLEPRAAGQLLQVVEALVVGCQQRQVERRVVGASRLLARAAGDVGRLAEDRFDLLLLAGLQELDCAEQVAVVGQRQRRLAVLCRGADQRADFRRRRQQAVVRAHVQVDEGRRLGHRGDTLRGGGRRASPFSGRRCATSDRQRRRRGCRPGDRLRRSARRPARSARRCGSRCRTCGSGRARTAPPVA